MVLVDDRMQNLERPVSAPGVVTFVGSMSELKKLPYWQQGDEEMYTRFHLDARRSNRNKPTVLAALQAFWSSVIYDPAQPHAELHELDQDYDGYQVTITRQKYFDIFARISRVLMKGSAAQAIEEAEAAWEQDTSGDTLIFTRGNRPRNRSHHLDSHILATIHL